MGSVSPDVWFLRVSYVLAGIQVLVRGAMNKDFCPNGCDLRADPIPQEYIDKGYYAEGVTHYSRLTGIEIAGVYDGVIIWDCPDCGLAWPRFTEGYLNVRAQEIIEGWRTK